MTEPAYRDITVDDLKIVEDANAHVKVMAGQYGGARGPVSGTYVDPVYLDVTINLGGTFTYQLPEEDTVFLLLLEGRLMIGGEEVGTDDSRGVLLEKGADIEISSDQGARFLLIAGRPAGRTDCLGRPDCDEHTGRTAACVRADPQLHLHYQISRVLIHFPEFDNSAGIASQQNSAIW